MLHIKHVLTLEMHTEIHLSDFVLALWECEEDIPVHSQQQEAGMAGFVQVGDVCVKVATVNTSHKSLLHG